MEWGWTREDCAAALQGIAGTDSLKRCKADAFDAIAGH